MLSHQRRLLTALQFFMLASLTLFSGNSRLALGQPDWKGSSSTIARSPNPKVNLDRIKRKGPDAGSNEAKRKLPKLSPKTEKQEAIELAIEDGNEARKANNYEKAIASYRKVAEELDPKEARAHYGLGNVYSDLSCNDNAIRAYTDALRLKTDFHDAQIALGYAYANKERYDEAEAQFLKLFKTTPNDVEANIGLASTFAKRKQYQEAIKQLDAIINNSSIDVKNRAIAHMVVGDIYMEQKKWQEAAVEFKKAIALNSDLAGAYLKLGQTE